MTVLDTLKRHLPPVEFFPVCSDFEQDDEAGTIFFQVPVLSFRLVLYNFWLNLLKAFDRIFLSALDYYLVFSPSTSAD